jgi:hypothetical protein
MDYLWRALVVLFVCSLLPIGRTAWAWHPIDHTRITQRSLKEIAGPTLDATTIPIQSLDAFVQTAAPRLGIAPTRLAFALWLGVDPAVDLGAPDFEEAVHTTTTPRAILQSHVNDPDDGRDAQLYARTPNGLPRRDSQGQPIPLYDHLLYMGGPTSQAFRHFEKPAFSWNHFASTLGYPFGEFGMASQQAQRYFDLADLAWTLGMEYWGWRFLACALHYVQDLTQPYHTVQLNAHGRYVWRGLRVWLATPNADLIPAMTTLMKNSHQWYETFIATLGTQALHGQASDRRAWAYLEALHGTTTIPLRTGPRSIERLAKAMRDAVNPSAPDLLEGVYWVSSPRLLSTVVFDIQADNPIDWLKASEDTKYQRGMDRIFAITTSAFEQAAIGTRTLVAEGLRVRASFVRASQRTE